MYDLRVHREGRGRERVSLLSLQVLYIFGGAGYGQLELASCASERNNSVAILHGAGKSTCSCQQSLHQEQDCQC